MPHSAQQKKTATSAELPIKANPAAAVTNTTKRAGNAPLDGGGGPQPNAGRAGVKTDPGAAAPAVQSAGPLQARPLDFSRIIGEFTTKNPIETLPGGSVRFKDALTGRHVIIGPRATQEDIDDPNRATGISSATQVRSVPRRINEEGVPEGAITQLRPDPNAPIQLPGILPVSGEAAPAAAPAQAAPAEPLTARDTRVILGRLKGLTGEDFAEQYEAIQEQFGDRLKGTEIERTFGPRAKQFRETATREAQTARTKREEVFYATIIETTQAKLNEAKTHKEKIAVLGRAKSALGKKGLRLKESDLTIPSFKETEDLQWGTMVKVLQKRIRPGRDLDRRYDAVIKEAKGKGMPQRFIDELVIPVEKPKKGALALTSAQGLVILNNFVSGQEKEVEVTIDPLDFKSGPSPAKKRHAEAVARGEVLPDEPYTFKVKKGTKDERPAANPVTVAEYGTTATVAARDKILDGEREEGGVTAYEGLEIRHKEVMAWGKSQGYPKQTTHRLWIRTLSQSENTTLLLAWLSRHPNDKTTAAATTAEEAAVARPQAERKIPTPSQMDLLMKEVNSSSFVPFKSAKDKAMHLAKERGLI